MSTMTVRRPTENAAISSKHVRPLPSLPVLHVGFCSARAVNDRYGMQLFACAIVRKTTRGVIS
ncbi:hypothetical protein ACIREE_11495 [Streptomyces sp. NPDC102467]|uniref:hypothetical protein n=1 Tax=Streptomyces sp. NPDC102467 TaxID=3366179 RepID=UPI0038114783